MRDAGVDLTELLRATVDALGMMDVAALERLSDEAERIAAKRRPVNAGAARSMHGALGELLQSTERSLRMLRGLHDAGLRRVGFEGLGEVMSWER